MKLLDCKASTPILSGWHLGAFPRKVSAPPTHLISPSSTALWPWLSGNRGKCSEKLAGYGPTVLRVVVGVIFSVHGYLKVTGGVSNFTGFLGSLGVPLPGVMAVAVTAVELGGGIALLLGVWNHWATKLLAINMLAATLLVHAPRGFLITQGGAEFTLLLLAALVSLNLMGPGKLALGKK